ncbi:molybdenum cofactor guanylyltransferase [Virgibacillus halophilus]|uniref:Probable molybdenum cofactor guanylyltransferase n=1 Tax=Tigheibacillus halophilus TaxID=361280 RepID=A0ABU5CBC6_9BACI|nr:molybdenum cofactor guanylyltransferase [Virgibacillus halophilus]
MKTCGVVLAGGQSRRMGTNKALLEMNKKPVVSVIGDELALCADEVAVIANDAGPMSFLPWQIISDRFPGDGPLAGIETALYHIDADAFLFAACDMPMINHKIYLYMLQKLQDNDAVIPVYENRLHPLAGIYRKNVYAKIQLQLQQGQRKVTSFFQYIHANYEKEFTGFSNEQLQKHFFNMNYPEQYEQAKLY